MSLKIGMRGMLYVEYSTLFDIYFLIFNCHQIIELFVIG